MALMKSVVERVLDHYVLAWYPGRQMLEQSLLFTDQLRREHSILDERILVLEQFCPWTEHLFELEADGRCTLPISYVIFEESTKSSWRIQAVPKGVDSFESRLPLPDSWRGLRDAELDQMVGIEGCVFVHRAGFIGGHKTMTGAIQMAFKALQ